MLQIYIFCYKIKIIIFFSFAQKRAIFYIAKSPQNFVSLRQITSHAQRSLSYIRV